MKSRIVWLILSCFLMLPLLVASCGTKTTTTTPTTTSAATITTKPTTTISTTAPITTTTTTSALTGKWWDKFGKPQYGGILNILAVSDPVSFDPYYSVSTVGMGLNFEQLAMSDWALDRETWDFSTAYCPQEYFSGRLAERWEISPDFKSYKFYIRKGIKWQDKPPMSGRELTAYDIEYHWQRLLGLGSGYTKPSPYYGVAQYATIKSIIATDKYTLTFNVDPPSAETFLRIIDNVPSGNVVAREVIEKYGNMQDWKNAIGTGPFILQDYVSGSSMTYIKNPNYWGYDERHPNNQLPYVDTVKVLIMPDNATALAALRTGKLDLITGQDWEQAASLKKTNPELLQVSNPAAGYSLPMKVSNIPFTDIRVRKAMQMSIDLDTIAKTYYGSLVEGTPRGYISPVLKGYYTPFDQWPKEVQAGYTYNPEGAKNLLAEAGYPKGFKTECVASVTDDLDLLQIIKAYFWAIDIDMQIKVVDYASYRNITRGGNMGQMCTHTYTASTSPPLIDIQSRTTTQQSNLGRVSDPIYDAMVAKAAANLDSEEQKKLIREADDYAVAHHWEIKILPRVTFNIYQAWLHGYNGEFRLEGSYYARFWKD